MGQSRVTMHIQLSDALSIFSDHLVDIRKACVENDQAVQSTPHKEWDIDTEPGSVENLMLHLQHLSVQKRRSELQRVVRRIDGRRRHYRGGGAITDLDIERAREYPIKELWRDLFGDEVKRGNVECPFHDDNQPSMSVGKYNRYKCFGCDASGDTIGLYMKVNGVDFITAVKKLI